MDSRSGASSTLEFKVLPKLRCGLTTTALSSPSSSKSRILEPEALVPWISTNGLHVKKRSATSITLSWFVPDEIREDATDDIETLTAEFQAMSEASYVDESQVGEEEEVSSDSSSSSLGDDNASNTMVDDNTSNFEPSPTSSQEMSWYEVQMKIARADDINWKTIYRGYSSKHEVRNLRPDTSLAFRMKKNGDSDWGSIVLAATEVALPTAEDLQRAVICEAHEMVLRIIGCCKRPLLKSILAANDRYGQTPLMMCASSSNSEMMLSLIEAGAEVNQQGMNSGKTALMISAAQGDIDRVKLLNRYHANWFIQDRAGMNSIDYAVLSEEPRVLSLCLRMYPNAVDSRDRIGWTLLLRAVAYGCSEPIVRMLLSFGADPNASDRLCTKSCLMVAASKPYSGIVKTLLEFHANPWFRNSNGVNALDMAKGFGTLETVKILEKAMQDWLDKGDSGPKPNVLYPVHNSYKPEESALDDPGQGSSTGFKSPSQ